MKIEDLVGGHILGGVDITTGEHGEECVFFQLGGGCYLAKENIEDGYRSSCEEIEVTDHKIKNRLGNGTAVVCVMRNDDNAEILDVIDAITGKIVLSIGTDYSDGYYPIFVSEWTPENLYMNAGKENT